MNLDPAFLGVEFACYGEYECTTCLRFWVSNRAWRHFGQMCKRCSEFRKPFNLEPLYLFACSNEDCDNTWKNKKVDVSLCCRCGTPGMMFETSWDRKEYMMAKNLQSNLGPVSNAIEGEAYEKKRHASELCQKCQTSEFKDCRKKISKVQSCKNQKMKIRVLTKEEHVQKLEELLGNGRKDVTLKKSEAVSEFGDDGIDSPTCSDAGTSSASTSNVAPCSVQNRPLSVTNIDSDHHLEHCSYPVDSIVQSSLILTTNGAKEMKIESDYTRNQELQEEEDLEDVDW